MEKQAVDVIDAVTAAKDDDLIVLAHGMLTELTTRVRARMEAAEAGDSGAAPTTNTGSPKLPLDIVELKQYLDLYEASDYADYDNSAGACSFVEFIERQLRHDQGRRW